MESTNTRLRLETDRLILRVPSLEDLDRWAEMMADENAARFIGGVAPKTIERSLATCGGAARSDVAWGGPHAAAIRSRAGGRMGADSR